MIVPTRRKKFYVSTMFGEEWRAFYNLLWSRAAKRLRDADRIVLVGYSMPSADLRAAGLILNHANKLAEIELCSGDANERLRDTFELAGFLDVRIVGLFENLFLLADICEQKCGHCSPVPDEAAN